MKNTSVVSSDESLLAHAIDENGNIVFDKEPIIIIDSSFKDERMDKTFSATGFLYDCLTTGSMAEMAERDEKNEAYYRMMDLTLSYDDAVARFKEALETDGDWKQYFEFILYKLYRMKEINIISAARTNVQFCAARHRLLAEMSAGASRLKPSDRTFFAERFALLYPFIVDNDIFVRKDAAVALLEPKTNTWTELVKAAMASHAAASSDMTGDEFGEVIDAVCLQFERYVENIDLVPGNPGDLEMKRVYASFNHIISEMSDCFENFGKLLFLNYFRGRRMNKLFREKKIHSRSRSYSRKLAEWYESRTNIGLTEQRKKWEDGIDPHEAADGTIWEFTNYQAGRRIWKNVIEYWLQAPARAPSIKRFIAGYYHHNVRLQAIASMLGNVHRLRESSADNRQMIRGLCDELRRHPMVSETENFLLQTIMFEIPR